MYTICCCLAIHIRKSKISCSVCVNISIHYNNCSASSRDDYDKEVKQAKQLQRRRHTTTPRRPRRPDIQVYHPRRRRKTDVSLLISPQDKTSTIQTEEYMHVFFLFQMDQNQELVLRLKSGTKVVQAQRLRPMGWNFSGLTIRRTLVPLHHFLCTRLALYFKHFMSCGLLCFLD